jgi:hypothetical protein
MPSDEIKTKEDVKARVISIFKQGNQRLSQLKADSFRQGLVNPSDPAFQKYYSRWSPQKTALMVSMLDAMLTQGYQYGQVAPEQLGEFTSRLEASLASQSQPHAPQPEAGQTANLRPKRSLTVSYRNQLRENLIGQSRLREAPTFAKLGFGNLLFEDTDLRAQIESELAPLVEKRVVDILSGNDEPKKFTNYWERYLVDPPTPEENQARVHLEADDFWLASLEAVPDFRNIVDDYILSRLFLDLYGEVGRLDSERRLLQHWELKRPSQAAFAREVAAEQIKFQHRGVSKTSEELLRTAYMAGFRQLDAHFCGQQTFKNGLVSYKKLDFELPDVGRDLRSRFEKLNYIQLGEVESAEYGTRLENQALLEQVMFECKHPGAKSERKFNYQNFVIQYAQTLAPILAMPSFKQAQKGLKGPELISPLIDLARQERILMPHKEENIIPQPPTGYLCFAPKEWMTGHRVAPQTLEFLGIPAYIHPNLRVALEQIRRELPDFARAVSQSEHSKEYCTRQALLGPLQAQMVRETLLELYQTQKPGEYEQVGKVHVDPIRQQEARLDGALKYIGQNQQEALNWVAKHYDLKGKKEVRRKVQLAPEGNWFGHDDWFLLSDHLKDLTKDGLSERIIKMSGAYSVTDEKVKSDIISRYGRSDRKEKEYLGRLLVFPNPLIYFEQHSKTDLTKPKYVAPDESCNPPMLIPVQAMPVDHNREYLTRINGEEKFAQRASGLDRLRAFQEKFDLEDYTKTLTDNGFDQARAGEVARQVYKSSTASRLYHAMEDGQAHVEITEGQKKAYKMFQSYKELIESEDREFLSRLSPGISNETLQQAIEGRTTRPNKLFVCSPGVWLPVKSWKKFTPEEKKEFLNTMEAQDANGSMSPINKKTKYAMIPSWLKLLPLQGRQVCITYDQDAAQNPNVTQSVSAMAQGIIDCFPDAKIFYRLIEPRNNVAAKGADDFLVVHGNRPFWDELKVEEVAANVSQQELTREPRESYIQYLIDLQKKRRETEMLHEMSSAGA